MSAAEDPSDEDDQRSPRLASPAGRKFALALGFKRIDVEARPISETPDDELYEGFGADPGP
jgi:hypothetical protein